MRIRKLTAYFKLILKLRINFRIIMLFVSMAILLFSLSFGTTADAVTKASDKADEPDWIIKSYIYYDLMEVCLRTSSLNDVGFFNKQIEPKHFTTGQWFEDSTVIDTGAYFSPDGAAYVKSKQGVGCSNKYWVLNAASHWGITLEELALWSGLEKKGDNWDHVSDKAASAKEFQKNYKEKVAGGGDILFLGTNGEYLFWQKSFSTIGLLPSMSLTNGPGDKPPNVGGDTMKVKWVDLATCDIKEGYYLDQQAIGGYDSYMESFGRVSQHVLGDYKPGISISNVKLSDVVTRYNKVAVDYQANCKETRAADPTAIVDPSTPLPVTITDVAPVATDETDETAQSSCNIKGAIGWIVCPVITFMADIADKAYTFIEGRFLIIDGDLLAKDETINAWKAVQGVANIAFVIAFLIIILSQVTSFGISNYGIKKMLPKLVVAAILVNLSYIICQLGVDLSNTVGSSVNSFFSNTIDGAAKMVEPVGGGMPTAGGGGMISLTQKILIGGVGVGAFLLSLSALMPVLIGAIISCVMILFILVGRKALIVLLTVLSPLAFVAYMLPNTKSLFDKWQKAFVAMLMVYPIVAVVFAGSKLAARILMPADSTTDDGIMPQIIASSMSVIPLFVVPSLLKKSMDGVAGIGAAVSKMSSAASSGGKKGVAGAQKKYKESDYGKFRSTRKADIKSRVRSGNYEGSKLHFVKNAKSKARGAINDNKAFGMVTGGRGAALGAAAVKQDLSDRKEFTESMGGNEELYKAVANGAFDEDSTAFDNLTDENKIKIQKMKSSNLHRSASTYLATAEYMTANGLDDGDLSHNAIKEAGKHGADQGTRIAAYKAAEDANKKSGNFSALRKVHNHGHEYRLGFDVAYVAENTRNDQEMSYRDAILKVAPKDLSKYSFKGADSAQASAEYNAVLNDNSNYAAASVNQFSDMNAGTQDIVAPKITDAGQKLADKRANDIGYANAEQVVPRFSNPQQAKTHLQNNIPQPPATPPATPPTNHHYN